MSRRKNDPLRPLSDEEAASLGRISRSQTEPAARVARAAMLLAVASGLDYQQAAITVGRRSGVAVSHLVARFNAEGLAALDPRHGGGQPRRYDHEATERILREARRTPTPKADGAATWTLTTLRKALRSAPDGLPKVSTYTIWRVLHQAGCLAPEEPHLVPHRHRPARPQGWPGPGHRPGYLVEKKLIEDAYLTGEAMGLSVWWTDQAGPFQTVPQAGQSWCPEGQPARQPHEYVRNGTAKALTLFHPADGRARVKGVTSCPNAVLHGWLKEELTTILASLPAPPAAVSMRGTWERWRGDRSGPPSAEMPPLRMLLVLDNLAGHKTPAFVLWLFAHGIMPLVHALGRVVAEHGRELPTHPQAASPGWAGAEQPGGDHRLARGGGGALE